MNDLIRVPDYFGNELDDRGRNNRTYIFLLMKHEKHTDFQCSASAMYIHITQNLACPCNVLALYIQTYIQYTNKETNVVLMPQMIHIYEQ